MDNYRKVTKDEFYEAIGPKDVVINLIGNYPYTSVFEYRNRVPVGKIVGSFAPGTVWPEVREYFIVTERGAA